MLKLHQNLFLLIIILPLHTQTFKFSVLKAVKNNFGAKLALKLYIAIIIPFFILINKFFVLILIIIEITVY
jgi:hypothetical protein